MENLMSVIVWFVFRKTILEGKGLYCSPKGEKKTKRSESFSTMARDLGKRRESTIYVILLGFYPKLIIPGNKHT